MDRNIRMPKSALYVVLIICLAQFWGCEPKMANLDSKGKDIICFGDSITKGEGSTEGNDFPTLLSQKLNMPVINAGVSGDTTQDALNRIDEDILQRDPRMVIVEFSGNDFLRGVPKKVTFDNLDEIVLKIRQKKSMVVLVEVAAGNFGDDYYEGFQEIAQRRGALLVSNIMKGIIANSSLKSDEIHPNDAGYRIIADRIYNEIRPLLR
jgi:acyl-CoA thioesterase-1